MDSQTKITPLSTAAFVLWVIAVVGVLGSMIAYGGMAGAQLPAPKFWPNDTTIARSLDKPTLLVFLHPECPCSRATLDNLEPVIRDRDIAVVVICLGQLDLDSCEDLDHLGGCHSQLRRWSQYSNVNLVSDPVGQESDRFGAATSGYCLLFDGKGQLLYRGGVTSSRGHRGANAGVASLTTILDRSGPATDTYPVYGCPLQEEQCKEPNLSLHANM
ncbi:hypothetical protein [Blastopirellula marina]|uniref:RedB protein n=1 Tax=Blastopirellula marina TaxID=124 RepID=A0A2S8GLW9_9BACT|nr:hypothetical protein [Blastopirellula marina]PQO45433.1 hypothetical protein C5Y93_13355 [Blastopirellula marina]